MKTKYKDIEFETTLLNGIWSCMHRSGTELGMVEFYERWGQFVFEPNSEVSLIFSAQCLCDIADFLDQLNKENHGET